MTSFAEGDAEAAPQPNDFITIGREGYPNATCTRKAFDLVWEKRGWLEVDDEPANDAPAPQAQAQTGSTPVDTTKGTSGSAGGTTGTSGTAGATS